MIKVAAVPSRIEPPILRFVVLGDGGEGMTPNIKLNTMRTLCDERGGCSFALYLGDNIYDDGIDTDEGLQDPQFEDKFELPYAPLDFLLRSPWESRLWAGTYLKRQSRDSGSLL